MNRTQRGASFTLGISSLLLIFLAIIFWAMFAPGDKLTGTGLVKLWLGIVVLFMMISLFFVFRRQSPAEPAADERDHLIKRNAVLASFISVWVLLAIEAVLPFALVGDDGAIPVVLLPIINTAVLLAAMLVYSAAVLIQYGWGGKNE